MSWWNSDWSYRKKLTFDNSGQSDNLTDFPVLVALTNSNFDFNKAKDNGEDIRFVDSDDSTLLKHEIEKWDKTNQKAWIWVKVPTINGSSATDFIYMYYGNAAASDNQDAANTWDANYLRVYHLNKASGDVIDSKSSEHGTNVGCTREATGQIDNCFEFFGDDYVTCPTTGLPTGASVFTIEAYAKSDVQDYDAVIVKQGKTGSGKCAFLYITSASTGGIRFGLQDIANVDYIHAHTDAFHYLCGVYAGTGANQVILYVDGASVATGTATAVVEVDVFYLGTWDTAGTFFDGKIDEVRFSNIARSADYVAAQYLSMTLAFMTFGSEEAGVVSKSSSDTGSGAESLGSRLFDAAETGSGIGASSLLAALIGAEETGLGSEFATKVFSAFDSGSGIDAVISRLLAATETGSALEVALLITVLISGDGGLGSDLSTLLKAILASDGGSGFDALKALIEFPTTGSDMRLHASPGQVRIPSKGVNL